MKNRTLTRIALVLCLTLGSVAFSASQAKAQSQAQYAYWAEDGFSGASSWATDAYNAASKASVRSYLSTAIQYYNNANEDAYVAWWYYTYTTNYAYADMCAAWAYVWGVMGDAQANAAASASTSSTVKYYISIALADSNFGEWAAGAAQ